MSLEGQHVVVIGGSSGIGYAVAEGALADGATVTVGSSNPDNVAAAAARLGRGARGGAVDVKDEASIAAFFAPMTTVDHLVFTAGDWGPHLFGGDFATMDFAAVSEGRLKVRFWGALLAIRHAREKIPAGGSVTLTDGMLAHRPMKGAPLTTAFAGATEFLTRGLAVDLAPIRVNAVCPGLTLTERWANPPEPMLRELAERQLIGRGARPSEVAEAYLYAMRATYTTGQVLVVDGGRMLT